MNATAQIQAVPIPRASVTPVGSNLLQRKCACGGTPGPSGECAGCRRNRLQRRPHDKSEPTAPLPSANEETRPPGRPLGPGDRASVEPRLGHDFGRVRVHDNPGAAASASAGETRASAGHPPGDPSPADPRRRGGADAGGRAEDGGTAPACPGGSKSVALNFVHLRAASGDPNADLTSANRIFAPCCVQFVMASGQTAAPASSDTWLGGDTDIQKGTSCGVPTTEELDTFRGASAAFGLSGRIRAFYVASCNSGDRGYSWPPYCATGTATAVQGMAVVTNSGRPRTLAHELGHILLDSGDHPADTNNLMHPTNTATADHLTPAQCATIFTNA